MGDGLYQVLLFGAVPRQVHPRDLGQRHLADPLRLNLTQLEALDQFFTCGLSILGRLEDLDNVIRVGGTDDQAVDDV